MTLTVNPTDDRTAVQWRDVARRWWPCLVVFLLAAVVRWPLLTAEFGRNSDGTGSFYGIIARNYLLRDNGPTLWMPVISVGPADAPGTLYAHHPPTVPLLIAASIAAFGDHDWAVRLPPFLFTLASVAAAYLLLVRRLGAVAATCGAGLMAFVPLTLRFGQMPDVVNSQLAFVCLVAIHLHLRLVEQMQAAEGAESGGGFATPSRSPFRVPVGFPGGLLVGMLGAMVAGFLTDWPAFFLAPVFVVHHLIARRAGFGWPVLAVCGISIACFSGLYIWISLAAGNWELILHQFLNRATRAELDNAVPFSWSSWAVGIWRFNRVLHPWPLLVLAGLGVGVTALCRPHRKHLALVGVPLAWAAVHVFVGRQGVLNHDWWWWPATPGLCIAASSLLGLIVYGPKPPKAAAAFVLAVVAALSAVWANGELRHARTVFWVYGDIPAYSARELGTVVREHTPTGRAAMLFETDPQPYVSYNADRPLIQQVWDVSTFERRMAEPRGDLFYSFSQKLTAPPATYVFPKIHAAKGGGILDYLRDNYPVVDTGKFWVFDLTRRRGRRVLSARCEVPRLC